MEPTTVAGRRLAHQLGVRYRIDLILATEAESAAAARAEAFAEIRRGVEGLLDEPITLQDGDWIDSEKLLSLLPAVPLALPVSDRAVPAIPDWHHVAATRDATGRRLYIDGKLAAILRLYIDGKLAAILRPSGEPEPGGLDVERLAAALNDAQIKPEELRLGHDLRIPAARLLAKLTPERPADEAGT